MTTGAEVLHALETQGWVCLDRGTLRGLSKDVYLYEVGPRVAFSTDTRHDIDLRGAQAEQVHMPFYDYLVSLAS